MSNLDKKMAVLVTSCDGYSDLWDIFFKLMDRYWSDIPFNVYLNTETVEYNKKFNNFDVKSINWDKEKPLLKVSWSERMLNVLDHIEEEYVFVLVEDFFLREDVQTDILTGLLSAMEKDLLMSQIQLFGTRINCDNKQKNIMSNDIKMVEIDDNYAKVCFVPTIWRKETLIKWLRPHESVWAFESCGASRAKRWKYPEKVYRVHQPAVFNYLWEKECYCVVNGKWMVHPLLDELFKDNGIEVDYSKRGTITMEEWDSVTMITIIKRAGVIGTAKKVVNRIRSYR